MKPNCSYYTLYLFIFFSVFIAVKGQDSTKIYKLNEITVSGTEFINPKPLNILEKNIISSSDAKSVAGLVKYFPSLKLQVNSRGESQIFLRGYGVRQLALFFDGIPLSVPWDNRIDLSLVPTNALNSIMVSNGTPSVLFGANTLSGIIAMNSFTPDAENYIRDVAYTIGSNNSHELRLNYSGVRNSFTYLFSLGYVMNGEYKLPSSVKDYYTGNGIRLNSDYRRFNGFGKVVYRISDFSRIGFSVSVVDAEKGVPPENNVGKPRYWRYPLWRKLTFILNGKQNLSRAVHQLEYAFSLTNFQMKIDQFTDQTYSTLDDLENNKDFYGYGRVLYSYFLNFSSTLKFSISGMTSEHLESFLTNPVEQKYSQNIFSIGAEYEHHTTNNTFLIGAGLDNQSTPLTGNKPKRENESIPNFKIQLTHYFEKDFSGQLTFGKKSRFPTLRELYSGALGRFVPNPDLKSEEVYNIETNWKYQTENGTLMGSFFYSLLLNGIQRITLQKKQFKRINKDQIRTYGVELSSDYKIGKNILLHLNLSYLNSFAKNPNGEFTDTLEYKPQIIAGTRFSYNLLNQWTFDFEANYVGEEYGFKEGNKYFQRLPAYAIINLRASYLFNWNTDIKIETFARIDNIFDKLYYTQWGLPEKGREFLIGVKLNY